MQMFVITKPTMQLAVEEALIAFHKLADHTFTRWRPEEANEWENREMMLLGLRVHQPSRISELLSRQDLPDIDWAKTFGIDDGWD